MSFTAANMPNQAGKTFIVTGANAGLGYETALALAQKDARVVLACRSEAKAQKAKSKILKSAPKADLHIELVDLTDLDSVKRFSDNFQTKFDKLDVLINNAGVMVPPYTQTSDGFELQMGANYFGHFLLTGRLLDVLKKTEDSRIVTLSSLAHLQGSINFDDLHWEESYSKMKAYQQSKLACLIFTLELQRRLEAAKAGPISVAAHPGVSPTELVRHVPNLLVYVLTPLFLMVSHKPAKGALPTLLAAVEKGVQGGDYYGPTGYNEMKGKPGTAKIASHAKDEEIAKRLWDISEKLTGFQYSI